MAKTDCSELLLYPLVRGKTCREAVETFLAQFTEANQRWILNVLGMASTVDQIFGPQQCDDLDMIKRPEASQSALFFGGRPFFQFTLGDDYVSFRIFVIPHPNRLVYGIKSTRQARSCLADKYTIPCEDPDTVMEVIYEHLAHATELNLPPGDRVVDYLHVVRRAHGNPPVSYVEYTSDAPLQTTLSLPSLSAAAAADATVPTPGLTHDYTTTRGCCCIII